MDDTDLIDDAELKIDDPPAVYVGPSHVGRGLFAQRLFVEDEIIGEMAGPIIVSREYGSEFCIELDVWRVIEPDEPFKFINHSCDPNCEIFSFKETQGDMTPDRVWLGSLRVIEAEEELTIDYGWSADAAIPCECHSSNCRGWVVDEEELWKVIEENGDHAPRDEAASRPSRL